MLQKSREAVVDYMMPLGLHHIFAWGHHYGPEPWCDIPDARPDWLPPYYHRADNMGIGFDRSSTGSNATGQYHSPLCEQLDNVNTCPENLLQMCIRDRSFSEKGSLKKEGRRSIWRGVGNITSVLLCPLLRDKQLSIINPQDCICLLYTSPEWL